ncbi:phage tail tube protein [Palleronia sp. KMU-117]|uniref:phage tail tube protein n=1 Tax=Palleronia sp. KMU-117 TaxID=3434108 RepID=UPI003D72E309
MPLTRGETIALGVAVESTRGTFAEPQDFIRLREPVGLQTLVEKVDIKEATGSGMDTQGQELIKSKVEGTVAFNLRFRTIGYLLKSLLGGLSSATEAGETVVYRHAFSLDTSVLQPSLSFALAKGELQHKAVNGGIVSSLELNFPLEDVINGTATLMGRTEANHADWTPAFASDDTLVPRHYMTIKLAADVAGLSGATAIPITEASIALDRQTREKMVLSSLSPTDFIARLLNVSGSFTWEKDADTYRDLAVDNTARALQIDIVNTAQDIGVGSNPTLTIVLPKVTLNYSETRPLDDVVTEQIEFKAHYDETEAEGVTMSLVNEKANYAAA